MRQGSSFTQGRYSHSDGRSATDRVRKYARILSSELVNHHFLLSVSKGLRKFLGRTTKVCEIECRSRVKNQGQ